jgi:hypothetical protein
VFLQRGHLDTGELTGWSQQKWGDASVRVRTGWPETLSWQSGETVVTAVGDVEPAELEVALAGLPRDDDPGTMTRFARSAFGWLPG